jgi:hypothetical protein
VCTTTTGTAQSVQSAQTTAAASSQASRTLSHPSPLPPQQARHLVRPSPVRAIPSLPTRASSSRSTTAASLQAAFLHPLPLHHRRCRPRGALAVRPQARVCLLMKRPSWCTALSSRCGIWSSVYQAGTCLVSFPPASFRSYRASVSRGTHRFHRAHGSGTSRLSATVRRHTSCTSSKRSRAIASSC